MQANPLALTLADCLVLIDEIGDKEVYGAAKQKILAVVLVGSIVIAVVTGSLRGRQQLVCKHLPTAPWVEVKLWKCNAPLPSEKKLNILKHVDCSGTTFNLKVKILLSRFVFFNVTTAHQVVGKYLQTRWHLACKLRATGAICFQSNLSPGGAAPTLWPISASNHSTYFPSDWRLSRGHRPASRHVWPGLSNIVSILSAHHVSVITAFYASAIISIANIYWLFLAGN